MFTGIPESSTLYVPKGTVGKYRQSMYNNKPNPWLAFGTVKELIDGDVDLDESITSADVTSIYNYLLENDPTHLATSDVDGDGNITAADITAIYNMILGE